MRLSISSFRKVFVVAFAASGLAWIGYRIVQVQLGYSIPGNKTEVWFGNTARMRELLYEKRPENGKSTIFVVSGSNSLFSIASNVLAEKTGYNVKNYSLHAGMHIDILFSQIRNKVSSGDIVVAPIEWEARSRTSINQFDYENYLHHFSRSTEPPVWVSYKIFSSVPLRRWVDGLKSYLYQPHNAVSYWDFYTPESLQFAWDNRGKNEQYTHRALNEFGDINIDLPMTAATWKDKSTFQVPEKSSLNWLAQLGVWNSYFEEKGVRLFLTFPILLEGSGRELISVDTWKRIAGIRDQMAATATPLHCDPVSATFSSIYRYDTSYHANAEGARQRTKELGECLIDFISQRDVRTKPIDPEAVISSINSRLAEQRRNFGTGNMPFQIRLREITRINQAIQDYHAENGRYPRSTVSADWGLPAGISPGSSKLLSSPDAELGVFYWSNETGYKLIAKAPRNECTVVSANWPQLIDPVGLENGDLTLCTGFGYWSKDQELR